MKSTIFLSVAVFFLTINVSFADGSLMSLSEEAYINDIPFNTQKISSEALVNQAMSVEFELAQENEVDDIPFNTSLVISQKRSEKAFSQTFPMSEESYIDDIPFDTYKVISENRMRETTGF